MEVTVFIPIVCWARLKEVMSYHSRHDNFDLMNFFFFIEFHGKTIRKDATHDKKDKAKLGQNHYILKYM